MTARRHIYVTVDCDDCRFIAIGMTYDTIDTLRDRLSLELGWSVRDGNGDIDLCGQCCYRRWPRPELTVTTTATTAMTPNEQDERRQHDNDRNRAGQ